MKRAILFYLFVIAAAMLPALILAALAHATEETAPRCVMGETACFAVPYSPAWLEWYCGRQLTIPACNAPSEGPVIGNGPGRPIKCAWIDNSCVPASQ